MLTKVGWRDVQSWTETNAFSHELHLHNFEAVVKPQLHNMR